MSNPDEALVFVSANPSDDKSSGVITAPDKSGLMDLMTGKPDLSGAVM